MAALRRRGGPGRRARSRGLAPGRPRRRRGVPPGGAGRTGRRLRRRRPLRRRQRHRHGRGLAVLHELGFRGRIVLASSMVVYGEGRYRCPRHGDVRPAAAGTRRPGRRSLRPALPRLRLAAGVGGGGRGRADSTRATCTQPPSSTRSTCARSSAASTARHRDRPAVPQRLRPADAPRHAVRRGGVDLPVRGGAGRGADVSSRTAARPATSSTCATSPAPTSPRSRCDEPVPGPLNVASGTRAPCSTWPDAVCEGTGLTPRSWVAAGWATSATSSPAPTGRAGRPGSGRSRPPPSPADRSTGVRLRRAAGAR